MGITGFIAVYFVSWWIVFVAVLSIGVRTQEEEGYVEPGTVPSAPVAPRIGRKMMITSVVALVPCAAVYAVLELNVIGFDDIPFLPKFPE